MSVDEPPESLPSPIQGALESQSQNCISECSGSDSSPEQLHGVSESSKRQPQNLSAFADSAVHSRTTTSSESGGFHCPEKDSESTCASCSSESSTAGKDEASCKKTSAVEFGQGDVLEGSSERGSQTRSALPDCSAQGRTVTSSGSEGAPAKVSESLLGSCSSQSSTIGEEKAACKQISAVESGQDEPPEGNLDRQSQTLSPLPDCSAQSRAAASVGSSSYTYKGSVSVPLSGYGPSQSSTALFRGESPRGPGKDEAACKQPSAIDFGQEDTPQTESTQKDTTPSPSESDVEDRSAVQRRGAQSDFEFELQECLQELARAERTYGEDHLCVAQSLRRLVRCLEKRKGDVGPCAQTVPLWVRILEIEAPALGPQHPEVLAVRSAIKDALRSPGTDTEVAEAYADQLKASCDAMRVNKTQEHEVQDAEGGCRGRAETVDDNAERDRDVLGRNLEAVATTLGTAVIGGALHLSCSAAQSTASMAGNVAYSAARSSFSLVAPQVMPAAGTWGAVAADTAVGATSLAFQAGRQTVGCVLGATQHAAISVTASTTASALTYVGRKTVTGTAWTTRQAWGLLQSAWYSAGESEPAIHTSASDAQSCTGDNQMTSSSLD